MSAVEPTSDAPRGEPSTGHEDLLHGVNPGAVIDAIKARAARRHSGDRSADGRRLGLVVEGGAMRGVCSGGGLVALEHLGLGDVFDEIYATSAGAMNASYFIAGQARTGITIYYDDMVLGRAIHPKRFWRLLDLDLIFDRIVGRQKLLRVDAIRTSPSHFFVTMLDAATGEAILVDTRTTPTPLLTVLKASTAVPVAYNRIVVVNGRPCIDAGVAHPFPMQEAAASACTDLLVLLTRPKGFNAPPPSRISRWLFKLYARGNQALAQAHARQPENDASSRAQAMGLSPSRPGLNIATLCTRDDELVDRFTLDPIRLHDAALSYGRRMLNVMGADAHGWTLPPPAMTSRQAQRSSTSGGQLALAGDHHLRPRTLTPPVPGHIESGGSA